MADKWRLEGTLFDACNCLTLCPCVYFQPPTGSDCRPSAAWHIEKGNLGPTKLDGLNVAGILFSKGNPLMGIDEAGWIIDEKASPAQREALLKIFSGQAGGMWAMMAKLVKKNLGVTYAKVEYGNDGRSWFVKAGNALDVKAGFVKAPPGVPMESAPKKAQTYDPLFAPTMEKIVGITDHYKAGLGDLTFNISGRYSSSGNFTYTGP